MDRTEAARVLMGDSLGFHIIFVAFGLTLPILVSWFEWLGIKKKDPKLTAVAKFWSKIMALLVITGVISGTVIALQMSLVWPGILKFGGEVIGLPFMFETYAFLIEATFLSIYMATWNSKKISQKMHFVFGLLTIFGSTLSAYAITSVNAWMNNPTGFNIVDGKFEDINVFKAMFSNTSIITFIHSMPAYYLSVGLFIAGLYAIKVLKSKKSERLSSKHKIDWFIIRRLVIFSSIMIVCSAITADITGKYIAKYEPSKLAVIELNNETRENAPLTIGGFPDENGNPKEPYFEIPGALSILAGNSTSHKVIGFEEFNREDLPPFYIRSIFVIKMTLVLILATGLGWYFVIKHWKPKKLANKSVLLFLAVSGWIAFLIMELGWMVTEIGRQPWAVRGYLKTADAATKSSDVTAFGYLFPVAFLLLMFVTVLGVRKIVRDEGKNIAKERK